MAKAKRLTRADALELQIMALQHHIADLNSQIAVEALATKGWQREASDWKAQAMADRSAVGRLSAELLLARVEAARGEGYKDRVREEDVLRLGRHPVAASAVVEPAPGEDVSAALERLLGGDPPNNEFQFRSNLP